MANQIFLAVDMGASSGRHMLGLLAEGRLELQEVYRFENGPVEAAGSLYWDLLTQWTHVRQGIRAAAAASKGQLVSVGVDTWGVDFGLLGRNDELLANPYHYRDRRTNGAMERAFAEVPRAEIFKHTGLQFMQLNTLYQLLAMKWANSSLLDAAQSLLMMPDLFHWLLSGQRSNEMTDASTTQFFDPTRGEWAFSLLERFALPTEILGPISPPGTRLGKLRPALAGELGLPQTEVVLPGTHDTASAVLAVPARGDAAASGNWCYISLGTWALMGLEVPRPIINDDVARLNFTNEGGVGGTTRLLKNICGLWLVQECRRIWNQAGETLSWDDLTLAAASAPPLRSFIDPDAPDFLAPADMPAAIREFCRRTGQDVPQDQGAVIRCALESLALKFRHVLAMCEQLSGKRIETIHIVGGGTKNRRLCQMAADATGRAVVAGPIEATAIGNVVMQAIAAGAIGSIPEAREIIARSFAVETFEPQPSEAWDAAYERFASLLG